MADDLEARTGADSIATIERVYDRSESGAYRCVFPGCRFIRRDPVNMWYHLHFGQAHGLSFGERTAYAAWKKHGGMLPKQPESWSWPPRSSEWTN